VAPAVWKPSVMARSLDDVTFQQALDLPTGGAVDEADRGVCQRQSRWRPALSVGLSLEPDEVATELSIPSIQEFF
jgi:hypothetical protein